jgi:uncharacterized protein (TIGR02118 family)
MIKLTVLYTPPAQVEEFDAHYTSVHLPLASQLPGLVKAETSVVIGMPDGNPAPYHRIAELYFEDGDAMGEAFASDAGKRTAADAQDLAARTGSTVTMMINILD